MRHVIDKVAVCIGINKRAKYSTIDPLLRNFKRIHSIIMHGDPVISSRGCPGHKKKEAPSMVTVLLVLEKNRSRATTRH